MALKDYFLSRRVANAMMSPSAILLGGLGASVAVIAGFGLIGAFVCAALGWSAKVLYSALSTPGMSASKTIYRASDLSGSWKVFFRDAQQARDRFDSVTDRAIEGPLKDRLLEIGEKLDDGLKRAWELAVHGQTLQTARKDIPVYDVQKDLNSLPSADSLNPTMRRTRQALESQLESAGRLDKVMQQSYDNLRLINAHLDEAVARGVELSVSASDPTDLASLDNDVSEVLDEMQALQEALKATM